MKKKLLLSLLIIITLFTITGCGNTKIESSSTSSVKTTNEFKIKDVSFKFDKDSEFGNIKYKNAEGLTPDESKQAIYLVYENKDIYDGTFVFRISMAYSDETTLDKFLEGNETTDKEINGINWKMVSIDSTSNEKETHSMNYATEKDGIVYAVSIITFKEANIDTDKLADIFIKGVTIK